MSNKVQHKRSSVAGKIPTAADLEVGEVALNLTDKKIYTKTGLNQIIELGGGGGDMVQHPPVGTSQEIEAADPADVPLTLKGAAAQTGNLQQWADSTGKALTTIAADGAIKVQSTRSKTSSTYTSMSLSKQRFIAFNVDGEVVKIDSSAMNTTGPILALTGRNDKRGALISATSQMSGRTGTSAFSGEYIKFYGKTTAGFTVDNKFETTIEVSDPTKVPLTLKGMAGQTGNLQEWQDSTGSAKVMVDSAGKVGIGIAPTAGRLQTLSESESNAVFIGRSRLQGMKFWSDGFGSSIKNIGPKKALKFVEATGGWISFQTGPAGVPVEVARILPNGKVEIKALAGTGTRMVITDSLGKLGDAPDPTSLIAIKMHDPAVTYPANAMVQKQDGIWRANAPIAPAPWDATKWTRIDTDGAVAVNASGNLIVNGSLTDPNAALNQVIAAQLYIEKDPTASQSIINGGAVADVPLTIQGMAAQTGNLQQWSDSAGRVHTVVDKEGKIGINESSPKVPLEVNKTRLAYTWTPSRNLMAIFSGQYTGLIGIMGETTSQIAFGSKVAEKRGSIAYKHGKDQFEFTVKGSGSLKMALGEKGACFGTANTPLAALHAKEGTMGGGPMPNISASNIPLLIESTNNTGINLMALGGGGIYFGNAAGARQGVIDYKNSSGVLNFSCKNSSRMKIMGNGDVSIGKGATPPTSKLDVNGTITGNALGGAISDKQLKEDIHPLHDGATDIIKALNPVTFEFIHEQDIEEPVMNDETGEIESKQLYTAMKMPDGMQTGFIAQEVETALGSETFLKTALLDKITEPAVVDASGSELKAERDILRLNETKLIPLLVKTIQELTARIEVLEST